MIFMLSYKYETIRETQMIAVVFAYTKKDAVVMFERYPTFTIYEEAID